MHIEGNSHSFNTHLINEVHVVINVGVLLSPLAKQLSVIYLSRRIFSGCPKPKKLALILQDWHLNFEDHGKMSSLHRFKNNFLLKTEFTSRWKKPRSRDLKNLWSHKKREYMQECLQTSKQFFWGPISSFFPPRIPFWVLVSALFIIVSHLSQSSASLNPLFSQVFHQKIVQVETHAVFFLIS